MVIVESEPAEGTSVTVLHTLYGATMIFVGLGFQMIGRGIDLIGQVLERHGNAVGDF